MAEVSSLDEVTLNCLGRKFLLGRRSRQPEQQQSQNSGCAGYADGGRGVERRPSAPPKELTPSFWLGQFADFLPSDWVQARIVQFWATTLGEGKGGPGPDNARPPAKKELHTN